MNAEEQIERVSRLIERARQLGRHESEALAMRAIEDWNDIDEIVEAVIVAVAANSLEASAHSRGASEAERFHWKGNSLACARAMGHLLARKAKAD